MPSVRRIWDDFDTMRKQGERQTDQTDSTSRPMTLHWRGIGVGITVSYAVQVGGGYLAATTGVVQNPTAELAGDFSVLPILQFFAIFLGGYIAGRIGNVAGFLNGTGVAIAFIVIWAGLNAWQESLLVQDYGPLALPPMNLPGVVLGDLLNLCSGAFGGWIADRWPSTR